MQPQTNNPDARTEAASDAIDAAGGYQNPSVLGHDWNATTRAKVQRALAGILPEVGEIGPADPLEGPAVAVDAATEIMVRARSDRAREAMRPFTHKDASDRPPEPRLGNISGNSNKEPDNARCVSSYSTHHLTTALALFAASGPSTSKASAATTLSIGTDYPIVVASPDWCILIAPRIGGDL